MEAGVNGGGTSSISIGSVNNHNNHGGSGGGSGSGSNNSGSGGNISNNIIITDSTLTAGAPSVASGTATMNAAGGTTNAWLSPPWRRTLYQALHLRTAADRLPMAFSIIASNGRLALGGLLGGYVALVLLWLPFWLLAFLVTEYGIYALVVCGIFFVGRCIIRLLAFPGSSYKVSGEIEREFSRYSVRMIDASIGCVVELCHAIASANQATQTQQANNPSYFDVLALWKKMQSYRSKVLGLYHDVLSYLYQPPPPPPSDRFHHHHHHHHDLHFQSTTASHHNNLGDFAAPNDHGSSSSPNSTRFGNNRLTGDVGNLAGVTMQAHSDGRTLHTLLGKVLMKLQELEQQQSANLFSLTAEVKSVIPGTDKTVKELLDAAKELRDILPSFKPSLSSASAHRGGAPSPSTSAMMMMSDDDDDDDDDDDYDDDDDEGAARATEHELMMGNLRARLERQRRRREEAEEMANSGSALSAVKNAASSFLPLLDPPPHTSVFGMDVLRGTVLARYRGATQFWIRRPASAGGGRIDCLHFPAAPTASPTTSQPHATASEGRRNRKAVMYCNPNAGLMEVATGMSLTGGNIDAEGGGGNEICWTDYYTRRGLDVYLFNYAGYGRSYGSGSGQRSRQPGVLACLYRILRGTFVDFQPSSISLRADAVAVASHIISDFGVDNLMIHGESIGGLAAVAAARTLSTQTLTRDKLSLLLCDRTFCNLEATAQRLVGSWSGPAIQLLTPSWTLDVAHDFVATTCPKIVANDTADSIISETSSLRAGLSIYKELRRSSGPTRRLGWSMETPLEYRMADFEAVGVLESRYAPSTARNLQPPTWPADKHLSLQECFHFAACARRIGKLATQERRTRSRTASDDVESAGDLGAAGAGAPSSDNSNNHLSGGSGLVRAWRAMSSCDGLCGGPLGASVKNGHDWTVSWLCSVVVFGGQELVRSAERRMASELAVKSRIGGGGGGGENPTSVSTITSATGSSSSVAVVTEVDFDCRPEGFERDETESIVHPKPIPEVVSILRSIVDSGDDSIRGVFHEIQFCRGILEYICARLTAPTTVAAHQQSLHFGDATIGAFLNLHCGHNTQYSSDEKLKLEIMIREVVG